MANNYRKNLVFTAACIGMCFFGVSMITLGSILPDLAERLQLSNLESAGLVTFLPIGMLVGSLVFGPVVDRFGHKSMLLISCWVVLLGVIGLSYFENIPMLQLSIFGIGFGGGILNGGTNALVADISDENEKGSRLSFLGVFYGLGALFIPVLLTALSKNYTYDIILQGIALLMFLGVLFCMLIRFPAPKCPQGFPIKEGLRLLNEKSMLILSFILFFQSGIESVCNNWSTSYFGQTTQLTSSEGLMSLTCMVIGMTIARIVLVVLFKKVKQETVLVGSLLLAATGFLLLYIAGNVYIAGLGMFIIGMGLASTFPVILGVLGSRYPNLSGTAFSLALVIALIGQTLLNNLMGIIHISYYPLVMIASLMIMILMFKHSLK